MTITNIILSEKKWNEELVLSLATQNKDSNWKLINNKSDFKIDVLEKLNVNKIFIPHWSYLIPKEIYEKYECIVFHMTDLPFGRGGSPLQNLILRGFTETKISAIKVEEGLDTGPIYLKTKLTLQGTAEEIFIRSSLIIYKMILTILENQIIPISQIGNPVIFKRRKTEESNIIELKEINQLFDYIRMLDCDGYPKAFIENDDIKFEFSKAELKSKNELIANVRIFKK
tara:strand:+ start:1564 stop:2247 length:684 start_codon:yes stop_codon:yes gene_type:complete